MIHIETLAETGSTNTDLLVRLRNKEPLLEGYWLLADRQIAGRGRQGRKWSGGTGNFMGSTIVHLHGQEPAASTLALVAGLAVYEALLPRIMIPAQLILKWPNDLLLAGEKLAGILLEREADTVIVGIGVNLADAPDVPGRKVVALSRFGPAPDRDDFARSLATSFETELSRWREQGLGQLLARWSAAAHPEGTRLSVNGRDGVLAGTFAGLADDGALKLQMENRAIRLIHAGDVHLEGEAG